jgi:hypothetical protein
MWPTGTFSSRWSRGLSPLCPNTVQLVGADVDAGFVSGLWPGVVAAALDVPLGAFAYDYAWC